MSLMTGASSFQGVRLERFHCIQRHLYVLLKRGYKLLLLGHTHPHEAHQVRPTLSNRDVDERLRECYCTLTTLLYSVTNEVLYYTYSCSHELVIWF